MSVLTDIVQSVVSGAIREILGKTPAKRSRRRKRASTATERLRRIEKLIRPAKKQVSGKRTVRTRSKVKQRAR